MGNLRSVLNALQAVGADGFLAASPEAVGDAERLILPGVGAFGDGMRNLRERGFVDALPDLLTDGRPLLGICLGMQLLASTSQEHGEHEGLNLIPGSVLPLEASRELRVPHVGWNTVVPRRESRLLADGDDEQSFYFAHSFHCVPEDPETVTGIAEYGFDVTAVVEREGAWGRSFTPRRASATASRSLRRFIAC